MATTIGRIPATAEEAVAEEGPGAGAATAVGPPGCTGRRGDCRRPAAQSTGRREFHHTILSHSPFTAQVTMPLFVSRTVLVKNLPSHAADWQTKLTALFKDCGPVEKVCCVVLSL